MSAIKMISLRDNPRVPDDKASVTLACSGLGGSRETDTSFYPRIITGFGEQKKMCQASRLAPGRLQSPVICLQITCRINSACSHPLSFPGTDITNEREDGLRSAQRDASATASPSNVAI